ncbi:MAG: metal-dependent hydrolase [Methanolobus sp.]|nr:metal-dependent hydrolase [Methanolobus sp.]
MVNTLSHLGVGLLIASVAGLEGRQRKIVAFLAILPDLDFFSDALLILVGGNFTHQTYVQLYYLFGHREFIHSLLFILFITAMLWFYGRDRTFTIAGFAALFSHFYLDYATTWKMRPLYPFIEESSIVGAFDSFDPIVMIVSLVPVYFLAAEELKRRGVIDTVPGNRLNSSREVRFRTDRILLLVLVLWCIITPVSKAFLVSYISDTEGHDISYQNSYPNYFGSFLSAYPYNQTHYKVIETSYWTGIKRSMFVPIVSGDGADSNQEYIRLATELYDSAPFQEIDYITYNVSNDEKTVTVTLQDARNPFAIFWTYFRTEYVFEFDRDHKEYTAYVRRETLYYEEAPNSWFWIPLLLHVHKLLILTT